MNIRAIIFDFDGVFTDNKVYIHDDGSESVMCDRGDGFALLGFRAKYPDIIVSVLSKDPSNLVRSRCAKLKINCMYGIDDKLTELRKFCAEKCIDMSEVAYTGNDLNDLEVMQHVGLGMAVADAYPEIKEVAHIILQRNGGYGAVREALHIISKKIKK